MEFWTNYWEDYGWISIQVLVTIIGAIFFTKLYNVLMRRWLNRMAQKDPEDATRLKFMKNAGSAIIWILALTAVIYTIPRLRALAITLFAGAGILVAIAGFAAQKAFSNVISGIFIVVFKPFRVGDFISIDEGQFGTVEDITLRHTVINNFENQRLVFPNSIIGDAVITNWSLHDQRICRKIDIGISYGSDIELASKIIQEVAEAHPQSVDVRNTWQVQKRVDKVAVRVAGFEDSSVTLRAWVWTEHPMNVWGLQSDIYKEVKRRFEAEGVEIPFPYRTIVYKNDLAKEKT